jgi:glycine/sarcosine N-methyltransferase
MDARDFYDGLGGDYDRMVSWETRLAREEAFFQRLFTENGTRSVLDAACGTGMHAIAFARRGLAAAGADLSPAMVSRAKENAAAAGAAVDFRAAAFGELSRAFNGPFDAVTCLGNSLPHLLDDTALAAAFTDFARLLSPRGLLVIQNRNYDRVLREKQRFMPLSAREDAEGTTLFLRITDFSGELLQFTIVTLKKRGGSWTQAVQSTPLRALRRTVVEEALRGAGFSSIESWGSYAMTPADAPDAADLVVAARR